MPLPPHRTAKQILARALSAQALAVSELEAARRANYGPRFDPALHRRLTAAQRVVLGAGDALHPLATS